MKPVLKNETFSNSKKSELSKTKLAMSLDYIFGRGTSEKLDFKNLEFRYSRRTGRLRYVTNIGSNRILFTFRPNGSIAPTIEGARLLLGGKQMKRSRYRWIITVVEGVSEFVSNGKTVFCRHVVDCDESLKSGEDVAVVNQKGKLLAVGKSVVSASFMKQFKKGVAVKVREGSGTNGSTIV
jgi:predicted RNA-binding protein (TIGR00451 family)